MINAFLIGESIYLRPLERADAPLMQSWFNDPEIRRTIKRDRPIDLQAEEAFIAKINQDESGLGVVIVDRASDAAIGACGLMNIDSRNRSAMFGITIGDKAFWGKGIAKQATALIAKHAFETLNLN